MRKGVEGQVATRSGLMRLSVLGNTEFPFRRPLKKGPVNSIRCNALDQCERGTDPRTLHVHIDIIKNHRASGAGEFDFDLS